jgi:MoxR-like ATPase
MSQELTDALAGELAPIIANRLKDDFTSPSQVTEIVLKQFGKLRKSYTSVRVVQPDGHTVEVGRQHPTFATLVRIVSTRKPVMLVGPAGSGKTSAAEVCATALHLCYSALSTGPQTTKTDFFGYKDVGGTYHPAMPRLRFERGGIMLFDEFDRGNAGALTSLNQMLANATCGFPDGMVARHPDFMPLVACNTYGMGANRQYVGSLQLDAATLDRFIVLDWPYDEDFERDIVLAIVPPEIAAKWVPRVQALRHSADNLGIRHIISPRASIHGALLLSLDLPQKDVEQMTIWKGLDSDTQRKIEKHVLA